ncbi:hypothetical protein J6590_058372 [Homalodisca vitripennis]|nr:hypothetical protein J6590_058372 [Homalodisca vitripennis]
MIFGLIACLGLTFFFWYVPGYKGFTKIILPMNIVLSYFFTLIFSRTDILRCFNSTYFLLQETQHSHNILGPFFLIFSIGVLDYLFHTFHMIYFSKFDENYFFPTAYLISSAPRLTFCSLCFAVSFVLKDVHYQLNALQCFSPTSERLQMLARLQWQAHRQVELISQAFGPYLLIFLLFNSAWLLSYVVTLSKSQYAIRLIFPLITSQWEFIVLCVSSYSISYQDIIKQNKGESRYSTRSMVLIKTGFEPALSLTQTQIEPTIGTAKLMCHLYLSNPMDVQEQHITNCKCQDDVWGTRLIGLDYSEGWSCLLREADSTQYSSLCISTEGTTYLQHYPSRISVITDSTKCQQHTHQLQLITSSNTNKCGCRQTAGQSVSLLSVSDLTPADTTALTLSYILYKQLTSLTADRDSNTTPGISQTCRQKLNTSVTNTVTKIIRPSTPGTSQTCRKKLNTSVTKDVTKNIKTATPGTSQTCRQKLNTSVTKSMTENNKTSTPGTSQTCRQKLKKTNTTSSVRNKTNYFSISLQAAKYAAGNNTSLTKSNLTPLTLEKKPPMTAIIRPDNESIEEFFMKNIDFFKRINQNFLNKPITLHRTHDMASATSQATSVTPPTELDQHYITAETEIHRSNPFLDHVSS